MHIYTTLNTTENKYIFAHTHKTRLHFGLCISNWHTSVTGHKQGRIGFPGLKNLPRSSANSSFSISSRRSFWAVTVRLDTIELSDLYSRNNDVFHRLCHENFIMSQITEPTRGFGTETKVYCEYNLSASVYTQMLIRKMLRGADLELMRIGFHGTKIRT